jgi:tetratricopeptide (TPR) repeat protein
MKCRIFYLFFLGFLLNQLSGFAQNRQIDSLQQRLQLTKLDSNRVIILDSIAYAYSLSQPAKGILVAQEAADLALKIGYTDGILKSLQFMANSYNNQGDYNKALEIFLKQLAFSEKSNNAYNMAFSLMNIGIIYTQQADYTHALPYYLKSDSIIKSNKITKLEYFSYQNLGDIYDRLNQNDSAYTYYNKAFQKANEKNDSYLIAASNIGLGNCLVKKANYIEGKQAYQLARIQLKQVKDDDLFCEATLNLAKLYLKTRQSDSALYMAWQIPFYAGKDKFPNRIKDQTAFLSDYYKSIQQNDSALYYLEQFNLISEAINSQEKVKLFQEKTFQESLRQATLEEEKIKEAAERAQQLQLLLMGIFIPLFFLITLLLSKRKVPAKLIKTLGIISLLLFFEYLTLLLHPIVAELTHHTPVLELLIFVCIAALLIPTHHRVERWLLEKLTHSHNKPKEVGLKIKQSKLTLKNPDHENL